MNYPKVSIVIPVYNGSQFLSNTISSCLLQDYPGDIEIIIIDDCSPNPSCEIINRFIETCSNIQYYKNETNIGLMQTNNKAMSFVSGEYIIYLGQDDILSPMHVRLMLKSIVKGNYSIAWCNSAVIDSTGSFLYYSLNNKIQKLKTSLALYFICKSNFISSTGLVIKFSSLENVGGWPVDYKNYGEWYLWIKLISKYDIFYCDEICSLYRRHGNNLSNFVGKNSLPKDVAEYYNLCREYISKLQSESSFLVRVKMFFFNQLWKLFRK